MGGSLQAAATTSKSWLHIHLRVRSDLIETSIDLPWRRTSFARSHLLNGRYHSSLHDY